MGSRFLTQKRAEQRGTWEVANTQSGAVEEKEKNLASHNRNVSMWKVATQDQDSERPTSECEQCKKAWMSAGKTGVVPDETVGHIQSVQCVSQEEVVTAAHNPAVLAGNHGRDHQAWERKEEYRDLGA